MVSNRLAFVALGLACVAAAAGGSYLATRHSVADRASQTLSAASAAPGAVVDAVQPVPATGEQLVVGEQVRPAATPAPASVVRTQPSSAARPTAPARQAAQRATRPATAADARVEPAAAAEQSAAAPAAASPSVVEPSAVTRVDERAAEPVQEPEPPAQMFEELTVAADSVIGLLAETTLTSERARIEDRVEARVVRDVRVGGRVAIPAGSRALGTVVVVERGGKMRDRARLGIRFNTLALSDGTRLPISTETIFRLGDAPGDNSAKKIGGGAVAGAILGAILGGGKGAAIGATTGAAGGSAAVMAGDRSEAVFQSGAQFTARILAPITVTVDR